jgi:hypothetical protein
MAGQLGRTLVASAAGVPRPQCVGHLTEGKAAVAVGVGLVPRRFIRRWRDFGGLAAASVRSRPETRPRAVGQKRYASYWQRYSFDVRAVTL